jgi:hypothetical protein
MPLKIQQFDGDGTDHAGETFDHVVTDPDTGEPYDTVITCRILSRPEVRAIYKRHTKRVPDPKTRTMVQVRDEDAAADELLQTIIVSWTGVEGRDQQPLIVKPETITALDDWIKIQVTKAALGAEVTGRGPDTFRSLEAVS